MRALFFHSIDFMNIWRISVNLWINTSTNYSEQFIYNRNIFYSVSPLTAFALREEYKRLESLGDKLSEIDRRNEQQ